MRTNGITKGGSRRAPGTGLWDARSEPRDLWGIFSEQIVYRLHTRFDILGKLVAVVGSRIGSCEWRTNGEQGGGLGMAHVVESVVESVSPSRHGAGQFDESHAQREPLEPVGRREQ